MDEKTRESIQTSQNSIDLEMNVVALSVGCCPAHTVDLPLALGPQRVETHMLHLSQSISHAPL